MQQEVSVFKMIK